MNLIKYFIIAISVISFLTPAKAEDNVKSDYIVVENLLPGLTCEWYKVNEQAIVLVCRDAKYGCEYFKVGNVFNGVSHSSLTLREGSCKEKQPSTPTQDKKK